MNFYFGLEAVLTAVRLIGNDHHIAARSERRRDFAKLLQGCENHPTRCAVQQGQQMLATLGGRAKLSLKPTAA